MSGTGGWSAKTWARMAGLGYLVIIVCGIYAEFFVRQGLIVSGDAVATAANITASEPLFRSAMAADLVMLLADVAVALALFVVFKPVSEALALGAAFFRLTHAAVVGVNLLALYVPLLLLGEAEYLLALDAAPRDALVLLLLQVHAYGYAVGLAFFGVYCALLGILVIRSGYVPRVLGVLLMVAAAGYLFDTLARTLMTSYAEHEAVLGMVVLLPAFVAELSFSLWLVTKGVDVPTSSSTPGSRGRTAG